MKLIDLLVRETLSGHFKWPEKANKIHQDYDGELCPDLGFRNLYIKDVAENHRERGMSGCELGDELFVTREQYEAALAAAQQPVWNGDGLPPVGCRVIFFANPRFDYDKTISPEEGQEMEVVAHKTTTDGNPVDVCYWDEDGGGRAACFVPGCLTPVKSEADKKRDAIIESLAYHTNAADAADLYKAIESGEVEGVKLDV